MLNKIVGYGSFLVIAAVVGLGMMQVRTASASTFGVAGPNIGYYDQQSYNTDNRRFFYMDGIPYGWTDFGTTADQFIKSAHDYLYNKGPNAAIHIQEHSDARASAMINMMMGVQTDDPRLGPASPTRYLTGIALAKQLFDQWAFMVRAYDTPGNIFGGSVDFNVIHTALPTDQNFSGIGDANTLNVGNRALAPRGAAHGDFPEVVYAPLGQTEIKATIVFTHKDGSRFMIKKWCGNMTGDAVPFPQGWVQAPQTVGSVPNGAQISAVTSTPLSFVGTATNTGIMPSAGGTITGMMQQDSNAPVALASASFGSLNPVPAAGSTTPGLPFSFTVPAGTPGGTKYCFWTHVTPYDSSGISKDSFPNWCYTVQFNSDPSIQGLNGDIHAGGGICNLPIALLPRNITGNGAAPSMGDYVVAASGSINNFTSNGGSGADTLKLGTNGGYLRACRPNLLQAAIDGRAAAGGSKIPDPVAPATSQNFDLNLNTGSGKPEVYYYDSTLPLNIYGTVHSKVTIVATLGAIHVTGRVSIDNSAFPSRSVPSLGVISQGDIVIDPSVNRVDAYLFSNSTIDTCDPGATPGSTACAVPQLLVNGFLMASNIKFNRLGPIGSEGGVITEKIVLNPQIYLNPPLFFDAITANTLQSQGEKPPLY